MPERDEIIEIWSKFFASKSFFSLMFLWGLASSGTFKIFQDLLGLSGIFNLAHDDCMCCLGFNKAEPMIILWGGLGGLKSPWFSQYGALFLIQLQHAISANCANCAIWSKQFKTILYSRIVYYLSIRLQICREFAGASCLCLLVYIPHLENIFPTETKPTLRRTWKQIIGRVPHVCCLATSHDMTHIDPKRPI